MTDNNNLADRLNPIKLNTENEHLDDEITESNDENFEDEITKANIIHNIFYEVGGIIAFFIKSIAFGYSINIISHSNWEFFGYLCVGIAVNTVYNNLLSFFKK